MRNPSNNINSANLITQAENLIIDGLNQINDLKIKLSTSLRTAKRLNDLVISTTTENFKGSIEYERIQSVFDSSCELELILENIKSAIDSIDSPLFTEAVNKLRTAAV